MILKVLIIIILTWVISKNKPMKQRYKIEFQMYNQHHVSIAYVNAEDSETAEDLFRTAMRKQRIKPHTYEVLSVECEGIVHSEMTEA